MKKININFEEYKFNREPIEYIQCPYCGSKLERVEELIPTSCSRCNHHEFIPKIMKALLLERR